MCCTKVAERANSDEEDDAFERIEELNHLEEADSEEEDDRIAVLEKELTAAKSEIMKLKAPNMISKVETKLWLALVFAVVVNALLHITIGAGRSPPPFLPPSQSPPSSFQCVEKQCESERRDVQFDYESDRSYAFGMRHGYVTEVLPNSNAERAGLQIGDEILRVNDHDVEGRVEWGIYDEICDPPHDLSDKIYRSIRGYYPEDCMTKRRWGESKTLKLVVRKNLAGFRRMEAAGAKFFKLGVIATSLLVLVFLLLSSLATCVQRLIDGTYFGRRQLQVGKKTENVVEITDDEEVESEDEDDNDDDEDECEIEEKLETTPEEEIVKSEGGKGDTQIPSTRDEFKRLMEILDKVQAEMNSKNTFEE